MLLTVLQVFFSAFVFIAASFMFSYQFNPKFYGTLMSRDLCCLLANTPALNAFLMFVVQTMLIVVEACFFRHISNSIIITLDIIYFLSMMLLVLYHSFKEAHDLLLKVA